MKVVVTDYTFDSLNVEQEILASTGCQLVGRQARTEAELIDLVRGADCVISQFAPVTANVIAAMDRARAIVRYGIGTDNVDLNAAREHRIPVCNVPEFCIDEVADHTLALLLGLTRGIVGNTLLIRGGKWGLAGKLSSMRALSQMRVGIIGFGRIGREVAERLAPFKCARQVFDPQVSAADVAKLGCESVTLDALIETSDAVLLHCPSTPATRKLINAERLARFKPGALLINVARGDVVDTGALVAALQSGHLGGAGLDVSDPEPIPADSPLRTLENVLFTAHIASCSIPAVSRLRTTVAETAAKALRGESLPNVVNGVGPAPRIATA